MPDVIQIAIQAVDSASKVIGGVGDQLDRLGKQSEEADRKMKLFGLSTEQIGAKMSQAGKIATVGLTLPIAGIAVAATKAASDLNETSNKIQTLFGNASDAVMKFADTAATSLGQSKKQALDAAADFAVFGKAAGLAGNDLVDFSKKNVQLAADMASFFNTSPEEAITAIGAAFRGESEPIRRYGVLINEASLKDEALRQGLIKTTSEALTPQQRVLAAQALIMQQTSAAAGDFAKTSEGLANQSRILNAQFQDTIAALGQSLLPIAVKVSGAANDLLKAFNNLSQPQKDLIVGFGLMAAAAGPVLTIGGKLVSTFEVLSRVSADAVGGFVSVGRTVSETAGYLKQVGLSADSLKFAFQNLKAGGALLGVELGIIIAGLIAIAKYLEEVGNAARATNDDLIAMSRSGDVFKQAGASTEILINGQNRLKTTLDTVRVQIVQNAKEYKDYQSALESTAKAAGYEINAQGNLVQVYYGASGRIEKVIQANYELSEAQWRATNSATAQKDALEAQTRQHEYTAKAIQDNEDQAARLNLKIQELTDKGFEPESKQIQIVKDDLSRLRAEHDLLTGRMTATQLAANALNIIFPKMADGIKSVIDESKNFNVDLLANPMLGATQAISGAAQSIEVLRTAMAGAVGREMESYNAKQDELKTKAAELQGVISTSYGKARDDAIASLGEINKQLQGNAQAHDEATKRILFDIAAQQLATIQDPVIRANAMNALALQWNLVDKATYDATTNIIAATSKLASDKNVDAFIANLKGISNKQLGITPIEVPIEPKFNADALKAKPLPTVELPVTPKIDTEAVRGKKLESIEIPVKPKIEPDAKGVKATQDAVNSIPTPIITPKVDSVQASKDIQFFFTDKLGMLPKDKTTLIKADTVSATRNTQNILGLYGTLPGTKLTYIDADAKQGLQTIDEVIKELAKIIDKTITIKVKYETSGTPPPGLQHGGSYIVPQNSRGSGDYFPVLAAPGERVTVQTREQQNAERIGARSIAGDTYNYVTNVYNPLAAAMLADKQRRDRLARSNARMGVI